MSAAIVVNEMGYSIIAPFFPDKFDEKGIDKDSLGIMFSTYPMMWLFVAPLTGKLLSRYRRRRVIKVLYRVYDYF